MRNQLWPAAVVAAMVCAAGFTTRASAQASAPPTSPAGAAFAEAVQLHDSGQVADAIPLFKQAIALGYLPVNQARFRLARAYARSGSTELAFAELEALAAAGFANTGALSSTDLDALQPLPRFQAFAKRVDINARPCAADPRFRAFDFWIGEWDVQPTGAQRAPLGSGATSIIERQLEGCVIQENWLPPGGVAGKSFNIYNAATTQWEQVPTSTSAAPSRSTRAHSATTGISTSRRTSSARPTRSG